MGGEVRAAAPMSVTPPVPGRIIAAMPCDELLHQTDRWPMLQSDVPRLYRLVG